MIKLNKILLFVGALVVLVACSSADEDSFMPDDMLEIKGIQPTIGGCRTVTRAASGETVPSVQVGRTAFGNKDEIVFTTIKRTLHELPKFTYEGIKYKYNGSVWKRDADNGPDKIYWSDNKSEHTFIGYSLPAKEGGYQFVKTTTTYAGTLSTTTFSNAESLAAEDLLLCYSPRTEVGASGIAAHVDFSHALSCVRVVVNINGYGTNATDVKVNVSKMVIKDQPMQFTWNEMGTAVECVDNSAKSDIALFDSIPGGKDSGKSKSFIFYGLTVPHADKVNFEFKVKYSDDNTEKLYKGSFGGVDFKSGICTTLNISLNHRGEVIGTDVEYNDWKLEISPDLGELRKKSTLMDIKDNEVVTIHGDPLATADDATWLYGPDNDIKDIYGHDGNTVEKAYVIKSAVQLLSFAKEVNNGYDFSKKFIRLDADITMQKTAKGDSYSWSGIGTGNVAFNGTFLGGDRYINRLMGSSLFVNLGSSAVVEQLHISTIGTIKNGALVGTNNGIISACKIIDDVTTTGCALVGTNNGTVYACYNTGNAIKKVNEQDEPIPAKLVGDGTGVVYGCYQVSEISNSIEDLVTSLNTELDNWYKSIENFGYTQYKYVYSVGNNPSVKKK